MHQGQLHALTEVRAGRWLRVWGGFRGEGVKASVGTLPWHMARVLGRWLCRGVGGEVGPACTGWRGGCSEAASVPPVHQRRQPGAAAGQPRAPLLVHAHPAGPRHRPRAALPALQGHLPPRPHLQGTGRPAALASPFPARWCLGHPGHGGWRGEGRWCDGVPLSPQNCLVRCEASGYTAVVGDFGLAEKIPTYRCADDVRLSPSSEQGDPARWQQEMGRDGFWGPAGRAGMGAVG